MSKSLFMDLFVKHHTVLHGVEEFNFEDADDSDGPNTVKLTVDDEGSVWLVQHSPTIEGMTDGWMGGLMLRLTAEQAVSMGNAMTAVGDRMLAREAQT